MAIVMAIPLLEDEPALEMRDACRARSQEVERLRERPVTDGEQR